MQNLLIEAPVTLTILIVTVLSSYQAFERPAFKSNMLFLPNLIQRDFGRQAHRFLTSGFIHADWIHLIFNMFVLLEFGKVVEAFYTQAFGMTGRLLYALMYIAALIVSSIPSYIKHKDNPGYGALGASGAVSAVVFSFILFLPTAPLTFIFLPFFDIPAILLGIGYLLYSSYMAKRGDTRIGHDAHFYGALFGFIFPIAFEPRLLELFIMTIQASYSL